MAKTYTLHIGAYTPDTIPMARLAEYMQALADMLGHEGAVHFVGIKDGSTQLVTRVDHEHVPKVDAGLNALMRGEAHPEVIKARQAIDNLLADDNASGYLFEDENPEENIIAFPGAARPRPLQYGPIKQEGTLDGLLVSVGGTDKTVHIRLQHGDTKYSNIDTDRNLARRLGAHLFEPIRVFGSGSWIREGDGNWTLRRFKVERFEVLRSESLRDAFNDLRSLGGGEWSNLDDAQVRLSQLRDEDSGPH